MKRALVLLFALMTATLTVFACGGDTAKQKGALVVIITTDLSLADMNTFRVEVSQEISPGTYGEALLAKDYAIPIESTLPATLTITAGEAPSQNVLVRAIGRKVEGASNTPVVLREVEVRVPSDRVAALTMILSATCAHQVKLDQSGRYVTTCPTPHESCQPTSGACGPNYVDVDTLPPYDQVKDRDAALPTVPIGEAGTGTVGVSEKQILSLSLAGVPATISGSDIFVVLPPNTSARGVAPAIVWRGAKIDPDPTTPQDFDRQDKPVRYTVTALDGSELIYTVHVSVATPDTKRIESFIVPNANTIYDLLGTTNEIELQFPFGADVTHVTPTVVFVGKSLDPPSGKEQDFTNPVKYTVTAYDGSTRVYTVIADIAKADAAEITSFKINGIAGDIAIDAITVAFDTGVELTNLRPEIQFIGKSISPASGAPQSFTGPVTYTVTSADGTVTKDYEVTVTRPRVSPPSFSPGSGLYNPSLIVVVSCNTPGAEVHVEHGSGAVPDPSATSPLYAGPIAISNGQVAYKVKAVCVSSKYDPPFFANGVTQLYTVNPSAFDAPKELTFGPTKCGQSAAAQTFAIGNTGAAAATYSIEVPGTPAFDVSPATGDIAANLASGAITVTPKPVPDDANPMEDITERRDITFSPGGVVRTVTLRQKVVCP